MSYGLTWADAGWCSVNPEIQTYKKERKWKGNDNNKKERRPFTTHAHLIKIILETVYNKNKTMCEMCE